MILVHPASRNSMEVTAYRIRVGDYRVLYIIDDAAEVVTIAGVGHRRDVYR